MLSISDALQCFHLLFCSDDSHGMSSALVSSREAMAKPEFTAGDRVSWNYGVGKGTGHIVERVTKPTKLYGKNFKATPEEPKYRIKSDKGKFHFDFDPLLHFTSICDSSIKLSNLNLCIVAV